MEALIQFLQNNTIILLIMFVIALLSAVMGIVLGWKRFYDDYLSKSVPLPVYVYVIIILFVVVVLVIKFRPATPATPTTPVAKEQPKELKIIKGATFGTQRVYLDGKHFERCKFVGTELVYMGEAGTGFVDCTFEDMILSFGGPAHRTLITLKALYATPEFRPIIDSTFDIIKKEGKFRIAIPPSDAADG